MASNRVTQEPTTLKDPDAQMLAKFRARIARECQSSQGSVASVTARFTEEKRSFLREAGLTDDDVALVEELSLCWPAECCTHGQRKAQDAFRVSPRGGIQGKLDRFSFWRGLAGDYGTETYQVGRMLDAEINERSRYEQLGRRFAYWVVEKAKEWPLTPELMIQISKERGLNHLLFDFSHLLRGLGIGQDQGPSAFYRALPEPWRRQVKLDTWDLDDEVMAGLIKSGSMSLQRCDRCGTVTSDSYGWGMGSCTTCFRCMGRYGMFCDKCPLKLEQGCRLRDEVRPLDPTRVEHGVPGYWWAVTHGMMWEEFLAERDGRDFDQALKRPCPKLERCDAWCAEAQKAGTMKHPPILPESCRWGKFFDWQDLQLGGVGTVEEYLACQRRQYEEQEVARKREAAVARKQERAAASKPAETPVVTAHVSQMSLF